MRIETLPFLYMVVAILARKRFYRLGPLLYPQYSDQCLVQSRCSGNACWVSECAQVCAPSEPAVLGMWQHRLGCIGLASASLLPRTQQPVLCTLYFMTMKANGPYGKGSKRWSGLIEKKII